MAKCGFTWCGVSGRFCVACAPNPLPYLDLGAFPSHRPGEVMNTAFLIALLDEPRIKAAVRVPGERP